MKNKINILPIFILFSSWSNDALIPIFVTILSAYVLKETPSKLQCGFIFLSVSGIVFIVLMNGSSSSGGSLMGIFLLLHESFKLYHLIGSILILLGVWGTNYFISRSVAPIDCLCEKE